MAFRSKNLLQDPNCISRGCRVEQKFDPGNDNSLARSKIPATRGSFKHGNPICHGRTAPHPRRLETCLYVDELDGQQLGANLFRNVGRNIVSGMQKNDETDIHMSPQKMQATGPRTYFGADDLPEESVAPAVPKTALAMLVAMFIVIPLLLLLWLIASGGPKVEPRPKAKPNSEQESERSKELG